MKRNGSQYRLLKLVVTLTILFFLSSCGDKEDMKNARILEGGITTIEGDNFKTKMWPHTIIHKNKNCLIKWDCDLISSDIGIIWSECDYRCSFSRDTPNQCSGFNSATQIDHDQWFFGPGCYSPWNYFEGF